MINRRHRLSDRRDLAVVYRRGRSVRAGPLSVRFLPNDTKHNRLAVIVSKKTAKSAPARNRIRRRLFSTMAKLWPEPTNGHDLIVSVFSSDLAKVEQAELERLVADSLAKAGLKPAKNAD
ncbi:MAG TPA: ribonuclease P protein component [Candidatus Saccharimonadales bacterium]